MPNFQAPTAAETGAARVSPVTLTRLRAPAVPGGDYREERIQFGRLECWICLDCGYSELYAMQLAELRAALLDPSQASSWADQIRLLGPAKPGPFR
jgi:hypothetical protein